MKTFLTSILCLAVLAVHAAPPPPANDNFANRIDIVASGSVSVRGVNAKATSEAGDPTIAGDVAYKSVWWTWTAPFNGPVTISTVGSSFDTLLGIFTGSALASFASVAESDDANSLYTSSVVFNAVGGVPYAILVAGFNGAGGKVALNVQVSAGSCAYSITPASRSVAYTSGSSSVAVTTTTGCTWSAVSNDAWLTVTSSSSGTGSGTVSYSIDANTALTSRIGTLTVASLTHTVTQSAAPACTYSISPTAASFSASPVTNSFTMSAGTGCAWTATPNASWITIQSGASGTGNGTTTYVVATNAPSSTRIGTITVAGLTHTITQAGTVPCTYSISPTSASYVTAGGSGNITISTLTACAWTASSPVAWITFNTTNGTGNATVSYTVAANASTVARSTTLTVAGISHTVSQAGAACTYALTPTSVSVAAGASTGTVTVTAGTGCAWSSVANVTWLTITSGASGSGNGTVGYSVSANPNTAIRAGTLTIGGQTFTVNQAAAACTYSIAPTAAHYGDASGTGSIAVTAGTGCAWTAVSNAGWITIDSGTPGSGNGTVGYTVAANVTTTSRTGTITVAGSTFTVTQDGTTPCTYGITPSSTSYTSAGGIGSVAVTANAGCTWSASSAASWVTISTASGSGNGTVPYTVAANSSSTSRSGTLTIAGNPFTITQTGVACTYSITPTTATYTYVGGSGSVTVTVTSGCAWNSSSDSAWLTVTSGASGTGNGTFGYTVAASSAVTNRTGRLTIASKILTVTQTAAPCVFSILPTSTSVVAIGGSGSIALDASDPACAWTVAKSATWITVLPTSGSGDASLNYTISATAITSTRTGTITVGGQGFSITQAGDSTVPIVSLTAPANGSTVSNVITLTATASDDVGISRVDFYRGAGTLIGTDTTTPYNAPYNTTNVANGSHTFYARAFDPANNQGLSSTNTVTVSNTVTVNTNQWLKYFGGTSLDIVKSIAVASDGSIVASGPFTLSVNIDGTVLTSAGGQDIFIVKYTNTGTNVFAVGYGGTGSENVLCIALDSSDNIFLGGRFAGAGNLGGGVVTSSGGQDMFAAKYSSTGVYQWSRTFGNPDLDVINSIAVTSAGDVVTTGLFQGPSISLGGSTLLNGPGGFDTFLLKLAGAGGAHVWSKSIASGSDNEGKGVSIATNGDILLTGKFQSLIDFTTNSVTFPVAPTTLVSEGQNDVYMARFDANGTNIWSKRFGGVLSDEGVNITSDSSGNIYMAGDTGSVIDFGNGITRSATVNTDIFLAKFNSSGSVSWANLFPGTNYEAPLGLAVDVSGNAIVTGSFLASINFGCTSFSTGSAFPPMSDAFVVKHSTGGVCLWAKSFGGSDTDIGNSVATDSGGNVFVGGSFAGTSFFNGQPVVSSGSYDAFIIKLAP